MAELYAFLVGFAFVAGLSVICQRGAADLVRQAANDVHVWHD